MKWDNSVRIRFYARGKTVDEMQAQAARTARNFFNENDNARLHLEIGEASDIDTIHGDGKEIARSWEAECVAYVATNSVNITPGPIICPNCGTNVGNAIGVTHR